MLPQRRRTHVVRCPSESPPPIAPMATRTKPSLTGPSPVSMSHNTWTGTSNPVSEPLPEIHGRNAETMRSRPPTSASGFGFTATDPDGPCAAWGVGVCGTVATGVGACGGGGNATEAGSTGGNEAVDSPAPLATTGVGVSLVSPLPSAAPHLRQ